MNAALVDGIVKAVLYEGYMLYPYRPSAVKNRQRFNFGVVYPRAYSESQNAGDAWTMQTECLVTGSAKTECRVRVRFLRMVDRTIAKLAAPCGELSEVTAENTVEVERLESNGQVFQPWQEAAEETIEVTAINICALSHQGATWPFRLSAQKKIEPIVDDCGLIVGIVTLQKSNISGVIELRAGETVPSIFKLAVKISNESILASTVEANREKALSQSLVSTHTILEVNDGEFISLVDPPDPYRDLVRDCQNLGTWPVLVGEAGERNTLLSSPIILYDYPEIAPESPGDLFDGAEIDEILSLRILTMTDEEKREMRESDSRARMILERTEALPEEHWTKLHGALRGLRGVKGGQP